MSRCSNSNRIGVDIRGLDRGWLLLCLEIGYMRYPCTWPEELHAAARAAAANPKLDYFGARPIKTDLTKDVVNPWLYDRDMNAGAFAWIVGEMRKSLR